MLLVRPVEIDDTILTSDIPEPDASVGEIEWTAGTYTLGTQRVVSAEHSVYEVIADPSTSDDPTGGSSLNWVKVGATNRYKMFDKKIGRQSEQATQIQFTVDKDTLINSVSAFNMLATTVNVTVTDPTAGEVYNKNINMRDQSMIADYDDYFFQPIVDKTQFSIFDLPLYPKASVQVTATGADVKIGEVVMGSSIVLGEAQMGSGFELLDFSTKERDEFGDFTIKSRPTADKFEYDIAYDFGRMNFLKNTLKSVVGIPCVWSATGDESDGTLVYGYYTDVQTNFTSRGKNFVTIRVEGLT